MCGLRAIMDIKLAMLSNNDDDTLRCRDLSASRVLHGYVDDRYEVAPNPCVEVLRKI
jgi:hypothetical protein